MSRRDPTRLLTTLLALAFLLHGAVRPLAMSASLASGPAMPHVMAGGMHHQAAAPAAESHQDRHPAPHRHCADDCCGFCVTAFTMSVGGVTIPLAEPLTTPVAAWFAPSAPRGPPRYRQPLPIGPPASRA